MPNAVNSLFGPPPIQTTLNQQGDQTGVPFQNRGQPRSELNTQWVAWFNALYAKELLAPQVISVTQAQLTDLAAFLQSFNAVVLPNFNPATGTVTLGTAPVLAYVTDYNHTLQWTGLTWEWGPGDTGSGMIVPFAVAPTGPGWHACNGLTVNYLKANGTLGSVTLPNTVTTSAYVKLGSVYSATITAGTPPTISTPTFTGSSDTTSTPTGVTTFATGTSASVTVASSTHTHTVTPTGTISTPVASGGDVTNFEAIAYFRQ